jgi:hypothetical protein
VQGKWCWHFWPLDSAKETCKHFRIRVLISSLASKARSKTPKQGYGSLLTRSSVSCLARFEGRRKHCKHQESDCHGVHGPAAAHLDQCHDLDKEIAHFYSWFYLVFISPCALLANKLLRLHVFIGRHDKICVQFSFHLYRYTELMRKIYWVNVRITLIDSTLLPPTHTSCY